MNIPISIFSTAFLYVGYNGTIAEFLILSFLRAAYVLMGGRLAGNFYLLAVKNEEKLRKIKIGFMDTGNQDISEAAHEIDHDNENDSEDENENEDENDYDGNKDSQAGSNDDKDKE